MGHPRENKPQKGRDESMTGVGLEDSANGPSSVGLVGVVSSQMEINGELISGNQILSETNGAKRDGCTV